MERKLPNRTHQPFLTKQPTALLTVGEVGSSKLVRRVGPLVGEEKERRSCVVTVPAIDVFQNQTRQIGHERPLERCVVVATFRGQAVLESSLFCREVLEVREIGCSDSEAVLWQPVAI